MTRGTLREPNRRESGLTIKRWMSSRHAQESAGGRARPDLYGRGAREVAAGRRCEQRPSSWSSPSCFRWRLRRRLLADQTAQSLCVVTTWFARMPRRAILMAVSGSLAGSTAKDTTPRIPRVINVVVPVAMCVMLRRCGDPPFITMCILTYLCFIPIPPSAVAPRRAPKQCDNTPSSFCRLFQPFRSSYMSTPSTFHTHGKIRDISQDRLAGIPICRQP